MIIEQRTYTLNTGNHLNYLKLYEQEGYHIQLSILGNLIGYYFTDIGPLNQIIHMWGYKSLDDRANRRKALFENPNWLSYVSKVMPMIAHQESKILMPAKFFEPKGVTFNEKKTF